MKGGGARKPKSRIVSFRVDEDDFIRLDTLAQQTSYSRAEVLRRCLVGARLKSTVDAQALTEVARVHADLNRIGGLLKLAIREGVSDRSSYSRLNLELLRLHHSSPTGGGAFGRPSVIVRHQRASASNKGFRQLARYIRGRSDKPRATWFLAANLPGVTGPRDLELACCLVEAVNTQNTRAGSNRTYHLVISLHPEDRSLNGNELRRVVENLVETLGFIGHQYIAARHNDKDHEHVHVAINKIHPETFRIHSPAWDHQKLFSAGRALEVELGLTPLQSRVRDREKVPQRAADHEAHHGIDSFARWARKRLGPALRAGELRSWDDVHKVCAGLGVVLRPHGNGLVFEDAEQGMRVKASFVDRQLSKARLCQRFGDFQPAPGHGLEAARTATLRYSPVPAIAPQDLWKAYEQSLNQARQQRQHAWSSYRDTASRERRRLKEKYRNQRGLLAALPVSARDQKRLSQQLVLRQAIESRALKRKLANQRRAIEKTPHPGTWRHFIASRAADRDARAIRLLQRRERQRGSHDLERG